MLSLTREEWGKFEDNEHEFPRLLHAVAGNCDLSFFPSEKDANCNLFLKEMQDMKHDMT